MACYIAVWQRLMGSLKGPIDMLTLYEQKYKEEVQKFANEQVGRRRRDRLH